MTKLLVPFDEHYTGSVTYKGGLTMDKVRNKFESMALWRGSKNPLPDSFLSPQICNLLDH